MADVVELRKWRRPAARDRRPRRGAGTRYRRMPRLLRAESLISLILLFAIVFLSSGQLPALEDLFPSWARRSETAVGPAVSHGGGIAGRAFVVDGDTIEISGQRIRLFGIDAPESRQLCGDPGDQWSCGAGATAYLNRLVRGREIICNERDRDDYGRIVAVCDADGKDIGESMVSEGWALAYRWYSMRYAGDEYVPRSERRGIWRSDFEPPWDWRRRHARR